MRSKEKHTQTLRANRECVQFYLLFLEKSTRIRYIGGSCILHLSISANVSICAGFAAIHRESFVLAFYHMHIGVRCVCVGVCCRVKRSVCCQRQPGRDGDEFDRRSRCSSVITSCFSSSFPVRSPKNLQKLFTLRTHALRPLEILTHITQIRSDQTRSHQIRSHQIRSDQVRSDQIRSGQVRSDQIRSDQIRSDLI